MKRKPCKKIQHKLQFSSTLNATPHPQPSDPGIAESTPSLLLARFSLNLQQYQQWCRLLGLSVRETNDQQKSDRTAIFINSQPIPLTIVKITGIKIKVGLGRWIH